MRFREHKGCSRLLHSVTACSTMNALYSAPRCMPQGQGLALHAAEKVGKNTVTVIPGAAVPTVPCKDDNCQRCSTDLPVTYGQQQRVVAMPCLLCLQHCKQARHVIMHTPHHCMRLTFRDYRFVQDLHGNSCIWKQASNSKCVHTIFYAKLMMRTTPVSGHAWRPCLDGS